MLELTDLIFYILGILTFVGAIGVITVQNPIFSALWLAVTMLSMAAIFVTLDATFIAGVQVIVYAGAVMVLFVMVLMLFDLRHEMKTFSGGTISIVVKCIAVGALLGPITASIYMSASGVLGSAAPPLEAGIDNSKALANMLFNQYLFGFEAIGVLLLVIAIGAVTLSRISGGTHAD